MGREDLSEGMEGKGREKISVKEWKGGKGK